MAVAVGCFFMSKCYFALLYLLSRSYSSFSFSLALLDIRQHVSNDMEDTIDDEYDNEFSLPRNAEITGYIDYDKTYQVSMETHIPETNVGYRLLQKMGWRQGQGLGSTGQGKILI